MATQRYARFVLAMHDRASYISCMGRRPISLDFSGAKLQELRERSGWTQKDLAQRCSVSHTTVGRWESGENKPSAPTLPVIAAVLKVKLDALLGTTQPAAK